jgi:hypothetical protein
MIDPASGLSAPGDGSGDERAASPLVARSVSEALTKANEPLANSCQQAYLAVGSSVFLTPFGAILIMFHLGLCLVS